MAKKSVGLLTKVLAITLIVCMLLGGAVAYAATTWTYSSAPEIYQLVRDGYNGGEKGPISVVKGTLKSGWSSKTVYLVTLSGTELVFNQSTEAITDLLSGFNLQSPYYYNVVSVIQKNIPRGANLVLAGHSLGGMIAQQVSADPTVKANYNILNVVCFGSPLLAAGFREGTVRRLGDVSDPVPYLSGNLFVTPVRAVLGLNREDGHYYLTPITAHNSSYGRADLWGKYDVTGNKYGSATLTLDLDSRVFFQNPFIDW